MDGRMTVCNLQIEGGARAGLVAPDQTTIDYGQGRPHAPSDEDWDAAVERWSELVTDEDANFDKEVVIDGAEIAPFVTWGTNPAQSAPVTGSIPDPASLATASAQESAERALAYQGLTAGTHISDIAIDRVFIGSCTNGRIEDLRAAAAAISGGHVADGVNAMVVPGSGLVKVQAEEEGLADIFRDAGFEWREAGCSMCLAMNPDKLIGDQLCASSSNRNFKGRQGSPTGRTVLMSPVMVAAAAVTGEISDARTVFGVRGVEA